MEQAFVLIKPDAVERGFVDVILGRFKSAGFRIDCINFTRLSKEKAMWLYEEHKDRKGFDVYIDFMSSGQVVGLVVSKDNAVVNARELAGSWDPAKAKPGTLRKDFGVPDSRGILNVVHASDSAGAAQREAEIVFGYALIK